MGAESQSQTGEPHAVEGEAQPLNQQSITYCFALSHHPGEDHTIARPPSTRSGKTIKPTSGPTAT
jgi:hypothetical protein